MLGDGFDGTAGLGIWNGEGVDVAPPVIPTGGEGLGGTTFEDTGGHTGRGDAPPAAGATGLGIANPAG